MIKALQRSLVEKDVENAYREALHSSRPQAQITSPYRTDGYAEWDTKDASSVRLLLETKFNQDFKSRIPVCNTLGQCLLYIKQFEASGEPLPNVILVGDKKECFVLATSAVKGFLALPVDWKATPSKGDPALTRALVEGLNILPYVYDVDEQFNFSAVLAKIETLAAGEQHSVRATPANIGAIFVYWRDRVFNDKALTAVEEVDVFLRCLFQPGEVYLHPTKKNILVVPGYGGGVIVNGDQYRSFFDHFQQGYKPSEIEAFYANKDRLIEDDARRRQGAFFTPSLWVAEAHACLDGVLGANWRDECLVWDPAAGTGNLTRDYTFSDLIISTAEKPDVAVIQDQGYNLGAAVFQYDFLRDESDVLPCFAAANHRDVRHPNSKGNGKIRKGLTGKSPSPDLNDLGGGEFGLPDLLTTSPDPSLHTSLGHGVCEVLKVGAQEQVVGVDAGGIVASVADRHPLGDVPVVKRPGKTVAKLGANFAADPSIPIGVTGTSPLPAPGGVPSGDVLPKPHLKSVVSTTGHRAPPRVEPVLECTTPKRQSSPFFEDDGSVNEIPDAVHKRLQAAAKAGKRLVFLMNPPYAEDGVAGAKGKTRAGVAASSVVAEACRKAKFGRVSRQLYAQFMYQSSVLARQYGFAQHTVALFSVPTFMSSGSYRKFRQWWCGRYEFQSAFLFQASHFADVSGRWGISFTVWNSPGKTDLKSTVPCTLKDEPKGTFSVVDKATKAIYNSDDRDASAWVGTSGSAKVDTPKFSSGLKVRNDGTAYSAGSVAGTLGVMCNKGNNLMESATGTFILSGKPADKGRCHFDLLPANWRRAIALYSARKLVESTWSTQKDEYLVPTPSAAYEQWVDDCHVYAILHNSNNCTAMRDVAYKGQSWTISNHFFWMTRKEALAALDTKDTSALYRDSKAHPSKDVFGNPVESTPDPYMAHVLASGTLNLSPEAKAVLDKLNALWLASLPHRENYAASRPELHLTAWDAGLFQCKHLWRGLFPTEWTDLQAAFKVLADKLRPGVYDHGFLLR